jgi:hypothetical protein
VEVVVDIFFGSAAEYPVSNNHMVPIIRDPEMSPLDDRYKRLVVFSHEDNLHGMVNTSTVGRPVEMKFLGRKQRPKYLPFSHTSDFHSNRCHHPANKTYCNGNSFCTLPISKHMEGQPVTKYRPPYWDIIVTNSVVQTDGNKKDFLTAQGLRRSERGRLPNPKYPVPGKQCSIFLSNGLNYF